MKGWLEQFATACFQRAADLAHDLKTPLNIGVLNLELLRMRVQKLVGHPDDKLNEYARAIETELRRMAKIFDSYFVYAVPPKDEPFQPVAPHEILKTLRLPAEWRIPNADTEVFAHRSRLRDLLQLLIEGATKIFSTPTVVVTARTDSAGYHLRLEGQPASESDFGKLFKFYYTDGSGNPDIALATARLIAETYGGSLTLWDENDSRRLVLDLQLPVADRASGS